MESTFYNILKHAHSGLRWVLLILLVYAIYNAFSKKNKNSYQDGDKKIYLFTLIAAHTQLLIGIIMYFAGGIYQMWNNMGIVMKDSTMRHIVVEHFIGMIVAITIITLGYSKSKKASSANSKHSKIFGMYLLALIIILASIPWPFRFAGAGWF